MSVFHIFKRPPKQREAACGYIAATDPKSGTPDDKAYPRCEECMAWFKAICWSREQPPTPQGASAEESE